MKKIKILWIITNGIKRNGICVSQLDYFKLINKDKFFIDVVAVHNNTADMINEYKNANCRVFELTDRRKDLFKYIKELKQLMINEKYDIVHIHGSSALMALELIIAKKCGIPVRIEHSRNKTCDKKNIDKLLRPLFYKNYNIELACGEEAGKWLFGNRKFTVIHNGKNLNKYKYNDEIRKKIRKEYNFDSKLVLGHIGLFTEQKNHEFLIDIFNDYYKQNKNAILVLIGEGNLMPKIKEKVDSYGISDAVIFLGRKSNVEEIIQGIDIMLFPSFYEGLPNVVIEWQAAGLPSIISNKITKECAVSELVKFASIENGTKEWIQLIETTKQELKNRKNDSELACINLAKANFDINDNTKIIEELYSKSVEIAE